jgi:hypothetical protein
MICDYCKKDFDDLISYYDDFVCQKCHDEAVEWEGHDDHVDIDYDESIVNDWIDYNLSH